MRILHVIPSMAEAYGGPPRGLTNLARAQVARGDRVQILPCNIVEGPQTIDPGEYGNLRVYPAFTTNSLKLPHAPLLRKIDELAAEADIIHVHGSWRYHLPAAARVARRRGIPFVVRLAGNLGKVTRAHKGWLKTPYFLLMEKRPLNHASAIHCCSRKESEELADLHLRPRRFIVPQPVESDLLDAQPDFAALREVLPGLRDEHQLLLFMGRISIMKRLELLVRAFVKLAPRFPEWRLVIAGQHELPEVVALLRSESIAAGLQERVYLPGLVRGPAKAALYKRSAVFVQPSKHENFGLSVAEAMMAGLPSVVSDGVALADDVAEAEAGLVADAESLEFERAIERMMADAELRERYGANAARLAKRFEPPAVAEALAAEYEACVRNGR